MKLDYSRHVKAIYFDWTRSDCYTVFLRTVKPGTQKHLYFSLQNDGAIKAIGFWRLGKVNGKQIPFQSLPTECKDAVNKTMS